MAEINVPATLPWAWVVTADRQAIAGGDGHHHCDAVLAELTPGVADSVVRKTAAPPGRIGLPAAFAGFDSRTQRDFMTKPFQPSVARSAEYASASSIGREATSR